MHHKQAIHAMPLVQAVQVLRDVGTVRCHVAILNMMTKLQPVKMATGSLCSQTIAPVQCAVRQVVHQQYLNLRHLKRHLCVLLITKFVGNVT